ncbi:MAG TPA: transposase [Pyrinomonadaceae bacterium]|nr:transposase [Pyrinomonadaceae bacterium]
MHKAFKYKLHVSRAVGERLAATLDVCRELYNAALQERRDAYRLAGVSLNYYNQAQQLPVIKQECPDVAAVHSQILQDTLRRVQKTFDSFLRGIKAGERVGYPRFRSKNRYDSFTYPQLGWKLSGNKLTLSKIGSCRIYLSRPVEGAIKTVTVKREADGWYVSFSVECDRCRYIPKTGASVGVDVGIENFATLSTGENVTNPQHLRQTERRLKRAQRNISRKKRGGQRWQKAVHLLRKQHAEIKRRRLDFFHKLTLQLIREFDNIAVEDLNIKGMVKNHHLAKSIADASWGIFISILECKAAEAGRRVVRVPAVYTSQDCSACGARVRKTLATREHRCLECGIVLHRDHNAAININARALRLGMEKVASPCEPRTYSA